MSNDDYLWDGSGEPDPKLQALERKLGTLRYQPSPLKLAALPPRHSAPLRWVALAASLVLVGLGLWLALSSPGDEAPAGKSVAITTLAGTPRINDQAIRQEDRLPQGQWLETNADASAKITLPSIGQLVLSPNSRLKLVALEPDQQRLALSRGTITADVNAPPRLFIIDTPSAKAVDLGCAYTLQVHDSGDSTLHVTLGYVSLEDKGKISIVPAGARCHTRVGPGPGTPFFDDAPTSYQAALERIDLGRGTQQDLQEIISLSQAKDTLTLWHLMPRVEASWRPMLLAAIQQFAPLPAGVAEADLLRADTDALKAWRKSLVPFWK